MPNGPGWRSHQFRPRAGERAAAPEGPPGLVMINPPYGGRIGDRKPLFALYGSLGAVLADRFARLARRDRDQRRRAGESDRLWFLPLGRRSRTAGSR